MAISERPDGVTIINDAYNASPDSMAAAVRTLKQIAEASNAAAYDASNPKTINKVFEAVISNF